MLKRFFARLIAAIVVEGYEDQDGFHYGKAE